MGVRFRHVVGTDGALPTAALGSLVVGAGGLDPHAEDVGHEGDGEQGFHEVSLQGLGVGTKVGAACRL